MKQKGKKGGGGESYHKSRKLGVFVQLLSHTHQIPPMMVLMREAWPGQSTRVNCTLSNLFPVR